MKNYNKIDKDYLGIYYYLNDKLHRIDGPAMEFKSGTQMWILDGKRHRENGPAIILSSGEEFWFWNGQRINCKDQKEFERLIKLRAFW